MPIASAFLVPGTPLPLLRRDNPPWDAIARGYEAAGEALAQSKPDVALIYSTQWIAVLDQLWQTRGRIQGSHVDENWHEYGELPFDIRVDTELAKACIASTAQIGVRSREVDYDAFPIDTGSIVATHFLLRGLELPVVLTSNNLYHDASTTENLGRLAMQAADAQGKRVAVIGVGGLSGSSFRQDIDIAADHIVNDEEDRANREMLALLERGDAAAVREKAPGYAQSARVDMGFKHLYWVLGALGGQYKEARTHAYGPAFGSGAAVVEFHH
ncbi:tRNA U-34 5-methylaminomethyl-2-thiouridine biosynthesis protein [Pigmentiphaga sp. NML080357]|uniref:DODA-type extradiol aromatic ring-opening family dioxygenase n=1 Tax=Pigmentiphaga sp. NML080357 TaxID=2008675 RepID=UPI000B40AA36|nr:tRNA U-34 5-methylaminomethyl-2-thiouridine biosynthesis protein [Pigmentiphaga sp. NML080357]OVZ59710.1 tRNA U-34 5-methylaminomethyl-2-thiouridine biosynthesis protein [Pigmentiphaga sp. NML080357]